MVKCVDFFYKRKLIFFLLLLCIFAILGAGITRLRISDDIYSALPKNKNFEQLTHLIQNKNISNQTVFSIKVSEQDEETDYNELVTLFADSLKIISEGYLSDIKATRPDVEQQVYQYLFQHFPYYIDSTYYSKISTKIQTDSIHKSVQASYNRLVSPGSPFMKTFILNDPLSISGEFFKTLNSNTNPQGIIVEDGLVYTKDKKSILITARTSFDPKNSENNVILFHKVENYIQRWNSLHPAQTASYFGTFEIAAQNNIQIKKDTNLTVFITITLILLILFVYYRKILIPVYFVLPAVFGAVFATGMMGFIKPEISAISLATSAILLGIILDYSFHFFTHLRHTRSIEETVKEIGVPLLTGSFTTITALAALGFANSVVLRDFGFFAALSLSGAALFTLIGLPVLLKIFSFDYTQIPDAPKFLVIPRVPNKFRLPLFIVIILLTVFFYRASQNIQFDSELENLSFHPESLKTKELELAGINPAKEKKIYLFASAPAYQNACEINYKVFEKILVYKNNGRIKSYLSAAQFIVPEQVKKERGQRWKNFWQDKKTPVKLAIEKDANQLGFSKDAFDGFNNWIDRKENLAIDDDSILQIIGINNLVGFDQGKYTFITTLVVPDTNLQAVKAELRAIEGVEIFDRKETAGLLLDTVKSDFNYILYISAGIVFFTLLLIFGRIELTLLAFFPMVISWIWILGIAAIFDIQFNFVNVVISTFIFGLGDDFSIFVTDGLLSKYKYRKDTLGSYTSAIVLSAVATIIGTGVLFFAKHPAIHSVAAISVLGIVCILFLSLVFQPILFDFFVQKRIERKRPPLAFFEFVISLFCLSYFVVGCFSFYPILVTLILLPLPKKTKTRWLNRFISFFSWTVIYSGIHVRKLIIGKENLDIARKPAIIIANHASFLDIILMLLLNPRIIIMVKDWVYNSFLFGFCVRFAGYIYADTEPEENIEKVKARIADGYSLMIFPEGTRSKDGSIQRFHKGAFYLAKELQLDIIPILIQGAAETSPKGNFIIRAWFMNLKILPRIKAEDASWGLTYQERTKSISKYFKAQYAQFKVEMETETFMWKMVFNNYIFKGPLIEWYGRIKWKLEFKNYQNYHELIGDRKKILDIGCGYGYFDLFLHLKNPNRLIIAMDYDEEKIEIAANVYNKTEKLQFLSGDIRQVHFEEQDVIFLNDVLHYLSKEEQDSILNQCFEELNPDGIIIIRDGITDLGKKHETTKLSELFSTKILGFNKKQNEFHFFSSADIKTFAKQNGMNYEMVEHSKNMSNVLFILRKEA